MQPSPGAAYLLVSSSSCGVPGQTTWTYTIVDDDAALSLTKNAGLPLAVAGQPTQFDVIYTVVVSNPGILRPATYSLADTPASLRTSTSCPPVFTLNGGATNVLAGGGPWTQPQWRSLAAGAERHLSAHRAHQYQSRGSPANDACAAPSAAGSGLHNSATATLQGVISNPTFNANACRNTPTPVWATLRKNLLARAIASDQAQVRLRSAGTVTATATTSGSTAPATASTGLVVLQPGNTLQFEESIKANGTGPDQAPSNYVTQLTCTMPPAGSSTVLPSGAGTALATRQQWSDFTPVAGDDIDCLSPIRRAVPT